MSAALRVSAIGVALLGAAMSVWCLLGLPGLYGADPMIGDPYYRLALSRNVLPFAGVTAALGALVALAAGRPRSRGRFAAAGLWLVLLGGLLVFVAMASQLWSVTAFRSVHYASAADMMLGWLQWQNLILSAGAIGLLAGAALWLLSYRLDRPRS